MKVLLEAAVHERTVLVVDDDGAHRLLVRALAEEALEGSGVRVLEAPDGERAMELVRRLQGSVLVLSDHRMPGMDGTEFLAMCRQERPELEQEHVLLTSLPPFSGHRGALVVPKPADYAGLQALIGALVAAWRTDRSVPSGHL